MHVSIIVTIRGILHTGALASCNLVVVTASWNEEVVLTRTDISGYVSLIGLIEPNLIATQLSLP